LDEEGDPMSPFGELKSPRGVKYPEREEVRELVEILYSLVFVGQDSEANSSGYKDRSEGAFMALTDALKASKGKPWLQCLILQRIHLIMTGDHGNYQRLSHLRPLAELIIELDTYEASVQAEVIRLLEYVICQLDLIPAQELGSLTLLLQGGGTPISFHTRRRLMTALMKWIDLKGVSFVSALRDVSLLDSLCYVLEHHEMEAFLQEASFIRFSSEGDEAVATINDVFALLTLLVKGSTENASLLRSLGVTPRLLQRLVWPSCRDAALSLIEVLFTLDSKNAEDYMQGLIKCLVDCATASMQQHEAIEGDQWAVKGPMAEERYEILATQRDILKSLQMVLPASSEVQDAYRNLGGFLITCYPFEQLTGLMNAADAEIKEKKMGLDLILQVIHTIAAALKDYPTNRKYFHDEELVSSIRQGLKTSAGIAAPHATEVCLCLLCGAAEIPPPGEGLDLEIALKRGTIYNPDLVLLVIEALPLLEGAVAATLLSQIEELLSGGARNIQAVSSLGLPSLLLSEFRGVLLTPSAPAHTALLSLLTTLAKSFFKPTDVTALWELLLSPGCPVSIYASLVPMVRSQFGCSFWEFEMGSSGHAAITLDSIYQDQTKSWPPNEWSFLAWVRVLDFGPRPKEGEEPTQIHILNFDGSPAEGLFSAAIDTRTRTLTLQNYGNYAAFPGFTFYPDEWYHIAVVQAKPQGKSKHATLSLFVNGQLVQCEAFPLKAIKVSKSRGLKGCLGTPAHLARKSSILWHLGPTHFIHEALTHSKVGSFFYYGPNIRGLPLWNAPFTAFPSVVVTARLGMDRYAQCIPDIERLEQGFSGLKGVEFPSSLALHPQTGDTKDAEALGNTSHAQCEMHNLTPTGKDASAIGIGGVWICQSEVLAQVVQRTNSIGALLLLVEACSSAKHLDHCLEFLSMAITMHSSNLCEMKAKDGYRVLGELIKQQRDIVGEEALQRLFELVGRDLVANIDALNFVLMDVELWAVLPDGLASSFLQWLWSITENMHKVWNKARLDQVGIFEWLIKFSEAASPPIEVVESAMKLGRTLVNESNLAVHTAMIMRHVNALFATHSQELEEDDADPASSASIGMHHGSSAQNERRVMVRDMLIETMCHLYALFSQPNTLPIVCETMPIVEVIRLVGPGDAGTSSMKVLLCGIAKLLQTQPAFASHFEAEAGFDVLALPLSYCSGETYAYRVLFSLLLGQQTVEDEAAPFDFITLCEEFRGAKDVRQVMFPQALELILNMLHGELSEQIPEEARVGKTSPAEVVCHFIVHLFEVSRAVRDTVRRAHGDPERTSLVDFVSILVLDNHEAADDLWHSVYADYSSKVGQHLPDGSPQSTLADLHSPGALGTPFSVGGSNQPGVAAIVHRVAPCLRDMMAQSVVDTLAHSPQALATVEHAFEAYPREHGLNENHVAYFELLPKLVCNISTTAVVRNPTLVFNLGLLCLLLMNRKKVDRCPLSYSSLMQTITGCLTLVVSAENSGEEAKKSKGETSLKGVRGAFHSYLVYLLQSREQMTSEEEKEEALRVSIMAMDTHMKEVYTKGLYEEEALQTLLFWLHGSLTHPETTIREKTVRIWKYLLVTFLEIMKSFFTSRANDGTSVDLLTDGFDLLLKGTEDEFRNWYSTSQPQIESFFSKVYTNTIGSKAKKSEKWRADAVRSMDESRKKKSQELLNRLETRNKRNRALQQKQLDMSLKAQHLQENMAQDEWLEYAARPLAVRRVWGQLRWGLVRGLGLGSWPELDWSSKEVWHLDFRVGPNSMRKKIVRLVEDSDIESLLQTREIKEMTKHAEGRGTEGSLPTMTPRKFEGPKYNRKPKMSKRALSATIEADESEESEDDDDESNPFESDSPEGGASAFNGLDEASAERSPSPTSPINNALAGLGEVPTFNALGEVPEVTQVESSPRSDPALKTEATSDTPQASTAIGVGDGAMPELKARARRADSFRKKQMKQVSVSKRVQQMLSTGDIIRAAYNCVSIRGLDEVPGIIILGQKGFYVLDYLTVSEQGEIIESDAAGENVTAGVDAATGRVRWSFEDVKDFMKRRHLLREVALEIFRTNGRTLFLVFGSVPHRDKVFKSLGKLEQEMPSHVVHSMEGVRALSVLGRALGFQKSITRQWQDREISNFDYLMQLNVMAGRSYNDLNCYPVFPWVLRDYSSDALDLNDDKVYRDLSKPMGAQTHGHGAARVKAFLKRHDNWEDPEGIIVPFHYGSHYSSAGIVLHYLIRLEPFTKFAKQLQGGKFDVADRLFLSVKDSFESASGINDAANLSDVKELTPEWFYLPEFLQNSNKCDFGTLQKDRGWGTGVDHVVLPPWAKGDPELFIRKQREALESDYVSAHLHEWIDLIFGYKQKGQAAIEAQNVFYYLTYAGAVDIDAVEEEWAREALTAQIANFGQTPSQVFESPHPARKAITPQGPGLQTCPEKLEFGGCHLLEEVSSVGHLFLKGGKLSAVPLQSTHVLPKGVEYMSWVEKQGSRGCTLRFCPLVSSQAMNAVQSFRDQKEEVHEGLHYGSITAAVISYDGHTVITGGEDTLVQSWELKKGKNGGDFMIKLHGQLHGHQHPIQSVAVSKPHGMVVSGDTSGRVIVWDLVKLRPIRTLPTLDGPVLVIVVHKESGGMLIATGRSLSVWTINGILVAVTPEKVEGRPVPPISSVSYSVGHEWDEDNVYITGHIDGSVRFWSFRMLDEKAETCGIEITRPMYLRASFQVSNAAISALLVDDATGQQIWVGDVIGQAFHASVGSSAGANSFNAITAN